MTVEELDRSVKSVADAMEISKNIQYAVSQVSSIVRSIFVAVFLFHQTTSLINMDYPVSFLFLYRIEKIVGSISEVFYSTLVINEQIESEHYPSSCYYIFL